MDVIMMAIQKGGVGKTTGVIELSNIFAQNANVLVIDLDPQRNCSSYIGADISSNKKTILDILNPKDDIPVEINNVIQNIKKNKKGRLDVIIASKDLANSSSIFTDMDDIFILQDLIEIIKKTLDYDYVFIDTAPGRSNVTFMAYLACDYIISPSGSCPGSVTGLMELALDLDKLRKRGYNGFHAKYLGCYSFAYEKTNSHNVMLDTFEILAEKLHSSPFETVIPKGIIATDCKVTCQTIAEYANENHIKTKLSSAYISLANEIKKRIKEDKNLNGK